MWVSVSGKTVGAEHAFEYKTGLVILAPMALLAYSPCLVTV